MSSDTVRRTIPIINKRGLHARAAAKFVNCAERFQAEIYVTRQGVEVPGRSIMGLMMLAASPGCFIRVVAEGAEARQALNALVELVENGFGEDRSADGA